MALSKKQRKKLQNEQLKHQLAEKEQQIETQKSNIEFLYDLFVSPQGEQTLKAINQDKISFAVKQLEKVKEYIDNHKCKTINDDRYVVYRKSLVVQIDNQIKQLKETENGT